MEALRRWWRALWGGSGARPAPPAAPAADGPPAHQGGAAIDGGGPDAAVRPVPVRRRYPVPPPDDPRREADLGSVLQALAAGPLVPAELGRRVGAGDWAAGRLDAVVDHGIATGVLLVDDVGRVRARYAD